MNAEIKNLVENINPAFGSRKGITLIEESYHACNPEIKNGWCAEAFRVNGETMEIGKVHWDFDVECDDASDYDWDFDADDFDVENTLDLTDEYDAAEAVVFLS